MGRVWEAEREVGGQEGKEARREVGQEMRGVGNKEGMRGKEDNGEF